MTMMEVSTHMEVEEEADVAVEEEEIVVVEEEVIVVVEGEVIVVAAADSVAVDHLEVTIEVHFHIYWVDDMMYNELSLNDLLK